MGALVMFGVSSKKIRFKDSTMVEIFDKSFSKNVYSDADFYIGITIETLISNFPEGKIGDIRKLVAHIFNNFFDNSFDEQDIKYYNIIS